MGFVKSSRRLLLAVSLLGGKSAWGRTETRVGFESTSYFSQVSNSSAPTSFSLLQMDVRSYRDDGDYIAWGTNSGLGYIADTREPLLKVNEAYVATSSRLSENWQFSAGRKLHLWSQMDQDWRLGLWQPRFLWDYLYPELQGLTGLFYRMRGSGWELMVLGAPAFIPEQGAPLRNDRGTIVSSSRWISQPANRVSLLDQTSPVNYYINAPPSSDVVANPGGALSLRLGDRSDGLWTQVGYAFKPMNQLLLSAEPDLQVTGREIGQPDSIPNEASGNVKIYPRVIYHQISEMSVGFSQLDAYSIWVSALSEQPQVDSTPNTWISQQVAPMFLLSPGISYDFPAIGPRPSRLKASILRQWGGDAPDSGDLASPEASKFEPRYPFRNAVQLEYQMPLWWSGAQVLTILTRGIYEWEDRGLVFSTRLNYRPAREWEIVLGADFLGQWGGANDSQASFGARYRSNDRIYGGLNYVF
jgi:hypothetical protein